MRKLLIAFFVLLTGATLLVHFLGWEMGDKDWYLMVTRHMLQGNRMYVDRAEVSVPMIYWLYALVIELSNLLHMTDYDMLTVITALVATLCSAIAYRLFRNSSLPSRHAAAPLAFGLLLPSLFILWANPSYFGDRDHLFFVLVFPYLLLLSPAVSASAPSQALRAFIAAIAALGFCIKPHTVILFLMAQLFVAWRERSLAFILRLETLIIGAGGALYIIAVWHYTPDYFTHILPIALKTYSEAKGGDHAFLYYLPSLIMVAVALADFRPRRTTPLRGDIYYWLWLLAGGLAYASLNNGWMYTFYAANALALTAVFYLWLEYRWLKDNADTEKEKKRSAQGAMACVLVVAANLAYIVFATSVFLYYSELDPIDEQRNCARNLAKAGHLENYSAPTFGSISLSAVPWPIISREYRARFVTRYSHLWMMPKLLKADEQWKQRNNDVLDKVADQLAADISLKKPALLFEQVVTVAGEQRGLAFFFKENKAFSAALSEYELISNSEENVDKSNVNIDDVCGHRVYKRH